MQKVHPQQIQFISLLVSHLHQNPQQFAHTICKFARTLSHESLILLTISAVPSVFGFYASQEHISIAFPFFCSLIATSWHDTALSVLTPFYCSPCTFRFIESVYDAFAKRFCHDVRYDTKELQKSIVTRYGDLFVKAITESFCLLPKAHQFILKYMMNQGWEKKEVMNFFLRDFVLTQLLRYLRSTPFKNHFHQLRFFTGYVYAEADFCQPLYAVIEQARSIYEIPYTYAVFDCQYVQLLMCSFDVDMILRALQVTNSIPQNVRPFLEEKVYMKNIDFESFVVRIYSRKPPQCDPSDSWRKVVFHDKINDFEHTVNPDYERVWLEIVSSCEQNNDNPLKMLDNLKRSSFTAKHRFANFENYALERALDDMNERMEIFERFLVYRLNLNAMNQWKNLTRTYLDLIIIPFMMSNFAKELAQLNLSKLPSMGTACQLMSKWRKHEFPLVVQSFLPQIVDKRLEQELAEIDQLWTLTAMEARSGITLPPVFKSGKMNQRVWQTIEHFKCINFVEFRFVMRIMVEAVNQIKTIVEDDDEMPIRFIVAYSDVANLPSSFLLNDCLIAKQTKILVYDDHDEDLILWSRLEAQVLTLMAGNDILMEKFLECQKRLLAFRVPEY